MFEVGAKQPERAEYRRAGHVDQRAVAFAAVEIDDVLELIEQGGVGGPLPDAIERRCDHIRFHPARGTLTARFATKELRDAQGFLDHAGALWIEPHNAAAKRRACSLQRFRIQMNVELRAG